MVSAAQTGSVVTINSDNVMVLNGRKVFPIGMSPGPPNNSVTPAGKDALQEFREAGALLFRINQTSNWGPALITYQQAALDWAAQHDMYLWLNLRELSQFPAGDTNTAASLRALVDTFRSHPALGVWKNFDEAWWGGVSSANLSNGYYFIKQEDTNHPVVQTHAPRGTVADLQPYNAATDVLALDIYPVAVPPPSNPPITNTALSQVGDWTKVLSQVAGGQKQFWLIEQIAFSGTTPPNKTLVFPTFQQSRYMAYQAIINGARGLMFFGGNIAATLNAQDAPYGWNWTFWSTTLKQVVLELGDKGSLTNALVVPDSTLPVVMSGTTSPDIEYCVREAPPYIFLLASKREGANASVTFSGLSGWITSGDVLYESGRTVVVTNGQFTDVFAPYDVHVYRFLATNQSPAIISQPQNQLTNAASTARFSTTATGGLPLSYRWSRNGVPLSDGGSFSGSTNATLLIANVLRANEGTYSVVITNQFNSTTSSGATLAVVDPVITNQPANRLAQTGGTATFSVGAAGTPALQFRWRKNGVDLINGGNIFGAVSSLLIISNVQSGDLGSYSVAVTNTAGYAISSVATLGIGGPPLITSWPTDSTNIAGTTVYLSVGAEGDGLAYQWLRNGVVLADSGTIHQSTAANLILSGVGSGDAGSYSVIVSNAAGAITSAPAALKVIYPMPYYEPFNYPAGSFLAGAINGNLLSWSDVGTGVSGTYVTNVSGNLSMAGLPPSSGNSIKFGSLGKSARFSFAPNSAVTDGTLYYSFLLKILDTTGLSASGIFFAGFNNSIGTQSPQPSVVGTRLYIRSAPGGFNLGVAKNSSTSTDWIWDSRVFATNQTLYIIGAYTFNKASSTDDVSMLWINPSPSTYGSNTPPAPSVIATTGADIGLNQIASFVFFQRDVTEPVAMIADELRVGTAWNSVVPGTLPPVVRLINASSPAAGGFQFIIDWSPLGSATIVSPGTYRFTDGVAPNYSKRFYQLRVP